MPAAAASSTSQRLLALLSLMQTNRSWSAPTLAARLEVGERTVRRDVERLRELGYTIDTTRGPEGGYRLAAGESLPPLLLDDEQAVAVTLALQTARLAGAGLDDAAARALLTVTRLLPDRVAQRIARLEVGALTPGSPSTRVQVDPEVLLRIGDAIHRCEELRFDVDRAEEARVASPEHGAEEARVASEAHPASTPPPASASPPPRPPRRVEPHHLLLSSGRWYLIGWSDEHGDWRVFRVDRLRLRQHTGRRFEPRAVPGGDPAAFLSARFKGSSGADAWACVGTVELSLPASAVAPFVGDGVVIAVGPERCRVEAGSWSWGSLAASFGRFDAELVAVGPAELIDAFAELARRYARAADRRARPRPVPTSDPGVAVVPQVGHEQDGDRS